MNNKFLKVIIAVYLTCLFALTVLLPTGGILILAKITGAAFSWAVACIPFFIAVGVSAPLAASKIIIDMSNDGGKK